MKKRTTLYVDADLLSKFKLKCQQDGIPMSRQYEHLIRGYLHDEPSDERMTVTDSMSVDLNNTVEAKSWIRQKLGL